MSEQFRRPRSYAPGFEVHAAPEAIKAHIDQARERQAEIQNELGWLEGLYLRRAAEKDAGSWPSNPRAEAANVLQTIPGADPGACRDCGGWRKAGMTHVCIERRTPEPLRQYDADGNVVWEGWPPDAWSPEHTAYMERVYKMQKGEPSPFKVVPNPEWIGPHEEWFCACRKSYGNVLRPASLEMCPSCRTTAPWMTWELLTKPDGAVSKGGL